jgi:hypothetical protein
MENSTNGQQEIYIHMCVFCGNYFLQIIDE